MSRYKIFRIKIQLEDTNIWREFEVEGYYSLRRLHEVIQIVMGWKNLHLYQFNIEGEQIIEPDPEFKTPESIYTLDTKLKDIPIKEGQCFEYIYDFGDCWKHKLNVEKIYKYTLQDIGRDVMNGGHKIFPQCIDGAKNCPPEDVGSVDGYFDFVESMNTKNEDYEESLEWYGSHYDENEFNLKKINKRLAKEL